MGGKILIVDDESDVGEVLRRFLEYKGYKATTLETAEEALELAAREAFDAILIDNALPKMSGMAALAQLKLLSPVVIMMTGHYDPEIRKDALLLGACEVLAKPFEPTELDAFLKKAFAGRRRTGPS